MWAQTGSTASSSSSSNTAGGRQAVSVSTYKDLSGPIKRFVLRVHPDVMHVYGTGIASANEAVLQEVFIMLDIIRARAEAPESATTGPVVNRESLRQSYALSFYLRDDKHGKAPEAAGGGAGAKLRAGIPAGAAAGGDGLPPGVRRCTVTVTTPPAMGDRMALLAQRGMREQAQARYLQLGTRIVQQLLDAVGAPLALTLGPQVSRLLGRSAGADEDEDDETGGEAAADGDRPFDPSDPDAAAKAAHRRVRAMQRKARQRERAVFADSSSLMDAHLRGLSPIVQGKVDPETAAAAAAYAAAGGGSSGGFGSPGGAGGGASARFAAAMQAASDHGPMRAGRGRGSAATAAAMPPPAASVFSPKARRARVLQLLARPDSVMEPLPGPGAGAGSSSGEGLTPALVRGAVNRLMSLLIEQFDPLQVYEEVWMRVHFALLPPGGSYYADAANRTLHLHVDFNPHALLDFCRQRFVPSLLDTARQQVARAADEQRRKAAAEARKRGRVVINPAAAAAGAGGPVGRQPKPGRHGPTSAGVGLGYAAASPGGWGKHGGSGSKGGADDGDEDSDDEGDDAVIGPASRYVAGGRSADREAASLDEVLMRQWANPKGEYR